MRKIRTVLFCILSVAIVLVMGTEVFAAVYLSVKIEGNVEFYAMDIGAKIFGTYAYNQGETNVETNYLNLSSGSVSSQNYVYYVDGNEDSYSNIGTNVGTISFTDKTDYVEFCVFIKNVGSRYIIPNVSVTFSDTAYLESETNLYYFDISAGQTDALTTKASASSASDFVSSIKTQISSSNYTTVGSNSSIDNEDVFLAVVKIKLPDSLTWTGEMASITSSFTVSVSFMADVQYQSNDILSVYQVQNQSSPAWTKFGYNATLSATPTKIESNSLSNLMNYLEDQDDYGNPTKTKSDVYCESAPVYKDIDVVNIDISTGEIIGKLSDPDYPFEWFGRTITLPAGTTLASGRTLTSAETFNVDVYTYYPTMYVRRWVVGDKQWLSVSDKTFAGAVEVEEYYTATFEATIFNPDKSVAYNSYGIIPRSYVYDLGPLTSGSVNYQQTNYGYGTCSGSTNSTSQTQMMAWATNLTLAWQTASLGGNYTKANLAQGENWTAYIYNILYLIKYANNNAQEEVGYGNTYTYSLYNGKTLTNYTGASITANAYYDAEKGGATIGCYNSSSAGTASYDSTNNYQMSATGYNTAGMNYGYNSTYTYTNSLNNGSDKVGLYATQFLTYNQAQNNQIIKRYLCDGYVGSDKYTGVFCLGLANPWGNVYKWVFGEAVISDGTNLFAYINFDNYNYSTSNWYFSTNSNGYASNSALLKGKGYVELSYNLPTTSTYYRYLGTSVAMTDNGTDSLIGLPTNASSSGGSSTGLCDYYYCNNSTSYVFGVLRGGNVNDYTVAGPFYFSVSYNLARTGTTVGFRVSLTP